MGFRQQKRATPKAHNSLRGLSTNKKIVEIIPDKSHHQQAKNIYISLKRWLSKWSKFQSEKENYSRKELNRKYAKFTGRYLKFRRKILIKIVKDKKLKKAVKELAASDFLFDVLLEGYSYDVNRTSGKNRTIGFLPFDNQLELIFAIQNGDKNLHIEKSRRQGISAVMKLAMAWYLKHGKSLVMFATHKDLNSLDGGDKDIAMNSTFEGIRWLLRKSIFIPSDWEDRKKYWTFGKGRKFYTGHKHIVINGNSLQGQVLGKGTAVGFAGDIIFVDEVDVVCEMYPNQATNIFGSFSQSVDRVFLYSTYRSASFPFYARKVDNDTKHWDFFTFRWQDNPVCNKDWYNYQASKIGFDQVLMARELDINPTKARRGRVWKDIDEHNYIDIEERRIRTSPEWLPVVGGDNGGTSQVYVKAYLHRTSGELVLDDVFKVNDFQALDVYNWLKTTNHHTALMYVDIASKAQVSFKGYGIASLLRDEGIDIYGVNNTQIFKTHALMRQDFAAKKIKINKNNRALVVNIESYRYNEKTDQVDKDEHSHVGDAVSYLWKGVFSTSPLEMIG